MTDRPQGGRAAELQRFYEEGYSEADPDRGALYARWRALSALGKARHVIDLCARAGIAPASTLEVGCGDGALLAELHRRRFGGELHGVEITSAAAAIARGRSELCSVELYDGRTLPLAANARDLGVLSHVLEHVPDPRALLSEVARACPAVVVEVPLEDNLSARRASRRAHSRDAGHLQRLRRRDVRAIVAAAGLQVVGELEDPLPLTVHRFFAATPRERTSATVRWAARTLVHRAWPAAARRLFTIHYACLAIADAAR